MNKTFRITSEGRKELEAELVSLKASRSEIADKIAAARDFGDLSENAEYDAARKEQGIAETRITEIEQILNNSELITKKRSGAIGIGSVVELDDGKKKHEYSVVEAIEANPLEYKISDQSPLGQLLVGKQVNDKVELKTPKGTIHYKISNVA
ncbi:transcription elongation factor GreA [Candidatus Saccharibacteria bacterium]|nr:transcription elongation factor GreA [Candidatus Saccharibacteria bacterium]